MAKAKVTAEEFAKLADALKAEYGEETDGVHLLKVDPVDGLQLANVGELQSALQKERKSVKELGGKLKVFDGLDAQAARDALTQIEEIKAAGGGEAEVKKKLEVLEKQLQDKYGNQIKQVTDRFEKEKGDLTKELTTVTTQLHRTLIVSDAKSAIAKHKGKEKLLLPSIERMARIAKNERGEYQVEIVGSDGNPRLNPKGTSANDLMNFDQLVESLKADPDYQSAFEGTGSSGSGSQGSSSRSGSRGFTISKADAQDPGKYRAAKAEAVKAGQELQMTD